MYLERGRIEDEIAKLEGKTPFHWHAAARRGHGPTAAPAWRVADALVPSIVPGGSRDTFTQTRTHGAGVAAISGLQR